MTIKSPLITFVAIVVVVVLCCALFVLESHQATVLNSSSSKFMSVLDKLNEYSFGRTTSTSTSTNTITFQDLEAAYDESSKWTIKETVEFELSSSLILELNSLLFAFMEGKKYGIKSASDVKKFQNYYAFLMPNFENMNSIQYAPGPKTENLFYSLLLGVNGGEKQPTKKVYDEAFEEYQYYLEKFHSYKIGMNDDMNHPTLDEILAYLTYDLSKALAKSVFKYPTTNHVESDADLEPLAKELVNEVKKMGYIIEEGKIINVMPKIDD